MKLLKKIFASKEVRDVLAILDELEQEYSSEGFRMVREVLEHQALNNPGVIRQAIQGGISARQAVYLKAANVAGDLVASGRFHVHRGTLNPLGPGNSLVELFEAMVDKMLDAKMIDAKKAEEQKQGIREQIANSG